MTPLPNPIGDYLEAYNRKDVVGMLACLSDEVVFQNLSNGLVDSTADGKTAFAKLATAGVQAFESRQQTVMHAITVADVTLLEINYVAVVAQDLPNGWRAGQKLRFSGASMFRVSNNLISSITDES